MKIYNEYKTQELQLQDIDYTLGYLKADKLFVKHHDALPEAAAKTVEEVVAELTAQGIEVEHSDYDNKWYKTIYVYENGGKDVEEVKAVEYVPAKDAYDEYEEIYVYILYTHEELEENHLNELRSRRAPLLEAFDKWEKAVLRGREEDKEFIMAWYYDLLDLKESAFENIPQKMQYYLSNV